VKWKDSEVVETVASNRFKVISKEVFDSCYHKDDLSDDKEDTRSITSKEESTKEDQNELELLKERTDKIDFTQPSNISKTKTAKSKINQALGNKITNNNKSIDSNSTIKKSKACDEIKNKISTCKKRRSFQVHMMRILMKVQ
jgi:hypothetical protein